MRLKKAEIQILDLDLKLELQAECGNFCKPNLYLKNMKKKSVDYYSSHYLTVLSFRVYFQGKQLQKINGNSIHSTEICLDLPLPPGSSAFDFCSQSGCLTTLFSLLLGH